MTLLLCLFFPVAFPQVTPLFSLEVKRKVNVLDYFPLHVGNRWVYQNRYETDMGSPPRRVQITWTREVTVLSHRSAPEGLVVHWRDRPRDIRHEGGDLIPGIAEEKEGHYLLQGNYVYELGRQDKAPEFFFPMSVDLRWAERSREEADYKQMPLFQQGKGGAPNPGMYYWVVEGREPDGAFLLLYRTLGGPTRRWFKEKVGVVRETYRHSGTYIASESVLMEFLPRGQIGTTSRSFGK